MADKLKSKVDNFINGDENTMAWVLSGISGNKITIGDEDDTLFNIVVVDNGKYVCTIYEPIINILILFIE
jgi:hypothetical protein